MWLYQLLRILYFFCVIFLPVVLDTGLQVWNGIEINSIDFGRTVEWRGNSTYLSSSALPDDFEWWNGDYSEDYYEGFEGYGNYSEDYDYERPYYEGFEPPSRRSRRQVQASFCSGGRFRCKDGKTCIPWKYICDGDRDCPQHESGDGGEDEVIEHLLIIVSHELTDHKGFQDFLEGSGSAGGDGGTCVRPPRPRPKGKPSKNFVEFELISGTKIIVSLETIVSLSLLQLPAFCLAVYGILCAFTKEQTVCDKLVDSCMASLVVFLPFCLTELFALLHFEFTQGWVNFILDKVKMGCQKVLNLICGKCSEKAIENFDLLKFLPQKDPTHNDRALSVEAAKLLAGSCPQLVFQAVLLGGFTPWEEFKVSQVLSILSSALMITKVVVEIVIFQRRRPDLEKCDEEKRTTKEKLREMVTKLLETLKKFLAALPLILSSLAFNTGTLVLTIIVTEWVSAVYIVLVLLLNMIVSFLYPNSVVRTTEEKLELTYKFSKLDEEREIQKIRETRMTRGLFNSWANLFVFLRPVEEMSYTKITHVLLLQPLRFLVNIVTLFILIGLTWSPPHVHNQVQEISLIVTFCVVFAAGLVNMVELFCYFFFGNHVCLSKPPPTKEREGMEMGNLEKEKVKSDFESTTTSIHSAVELEHASKDERTSLLSEISVSAKDETTEKGGKEVSQADENLSNAKKEQQAQEAEKVTATDNGEIAVSAEMRPSVRRLMTQVSVRSVMDVFDDDIVDPNSELTQDEVNQRILKVQDKGMVDKETFISDMMSFFPNYDAESNRNKLGNLFDRLDKVAGPPSGYITSRQYMLVTVAFSNLNLEDKLVKIFKLIDENGDEELTFEEFEDVVKDILLLKEEKKLSTSLMKGRFSENMFRDMGVNPERKINLRAFVDSCTKHRFIIINYVENFREGFIIGGHKE